MMYDIEITREAENDLNEAVDYIEYTLKNPRAADGFVDAVSETVSALAEFPERGSIADDPVLGAWGFRFVPVNNYIIFCTISKERQRVYVIRLLYGKREWIGILKNTGMPFPG